MYKTRDPVSDIFPLHNQQSFFIYNFHYIFCALVKVYSLLYNNNNNKHFFNLQVANSPSRLRFEANLSRESSECTEHSQDQMSQINTGKTVYVGNAWLKKYVLRLFRKDKYVGAERTVLGKWFQRNGAAWANERKPFDFLLKNGNVRGLKEEERRECEFNLLISNEFK